MSILNTSECQKEAFDFMAYYMSLAEPLVKGDTESSYGKGGNTWAFFSVWEKYLREEIYESKRPYMSAGGKEIFFTEEQCEHLKEMITNAIPDTRTQRVLYEMLMEEMDGYFQGGKELNSACEALQGRALLYLLETKR